MKEITDKKVFDSCQDEFLWKKTVDLHIVYDTEADAFFYKVFPPYKAPGCFVDDKDKLSGVILTTGDGSLVHIKFSAAKPAEKKADVQ